MKYGFLIDHRKCIGCHACTVACKAEHNVPLGSFRTWVKYIEKGEYPDTRRHFSVLRCNHCDDAPCVTICPTTALYKRADGIVDFNGDRCIGCKSCMQACPYDALYINPNTHTAEKCNFCAHRVELQLEPACVIVCPVQAIVSGDLEDATSKISRLVATEETRVRKPEMQTRPKLYYLDANPSSLIPSEQTHAAGYLWAEQQHDAIFQDVQAMATAEAKARTTYDVTHERPWGWKVSTYLWTKSISAGAFLLAAIAMGFGFVPNSFLFDSVAPLVALVFLGTTLALLVMDLKRPERFLFILLRPQWRSWLVLGGYILGVYGALLMAWLLIPFMRWQAFADAIMWAGAGFAILAAIYSAFLFKQARGRVFWNSLLTPWHLLAQAIIAGAAALLIFGSLSALLLNAGIGSTTFRFLQYELIGALTAHAVLMFGEVFMPEENADKTRAARLIAKGIFSRWFWVGAVLVGTLLPVILLLFGAENEVLTTLGAVLALAGLLIWEHIWVQAGQAVPLS